MHIIRGGGHSAVNRSVARGFSQLTIPYNVNPSSLDQLYDVVWAVCGIETLQQVIQLKRDGRIKYLLVGPNLMVRANEYNNMLSSPEIDWMIVPSEWTKVAYEQDNPTLIGRITTIYAGIDETYWSPETLSNTFKKTVLIYWKAESEGRAFLQNIIDTLSSCLPKKSQWKIVVLEYGKHTAKQFKEVLNQTAYAIFVSPTESQGIALAEAWAMNIPTIVWDPQRLDMHGRHHDIVSACPYLTEATGVTWKTMHDLESILKSIHEHNLLAAFSPRAWVLEHMTDKIAAQRFVDHVARVCPI